MVFTFRGSGTQSFRLGAGNVTHPSLAFVNSTNTGLFYQNGNIGFSVNGSESMRITANGIIVNGNVTANTFYGDGSQLSGLDLQTTVSNIQVADSTYTILDDTTVSTDGGFIVINGNGFIGGTMVLVDGTPALSTVALSYTQLGAQIQAKAAGTYSVTLVRPDSVSVNVPLGLTYSAFPAWSTGTTLPDITQNVAFSRTLAATSDSTITYANTSALPPQTALAPTTGVFNGNVTSGNDDVTYTFTVKAQDAELQDTSRTFQVSYKYAITDLPTLLGLSGGVDSSFYIARQRGYGFGLNTSYQLGIGNTTQMITPTNIMSFGSLVGRTVSKITCGLNHTMIVCTDGTLHGVGVNSSGQLGIGNTTQMTVPVLVTAGTLSGKTVSDVSCGQQFSIVLCTDSTLHSFGINNTGQLGRALNYGLTTANPTPALVIDGTMAGKTKMKIASGGAHTLVLCTDGTLHGFGSANNGQLGSLPTGYTPGNISSQGSLNTRTPGYIRCGSYFSLVLCNDGTTHSFGINTNGQLGTGNTFSMSTPINITNTGSLTGRTVMKIDGGASHTVAVCTDGSVHAFGLNTSGQLGLGNTTQMILPTLVTTGTLSGKSGLTTTCGNAHTLVLCADGTLHGFGNNGNGQLAFTANAVNSIPVSIARM